MARQRGVVVLAVLFAVLMGLEVVAQASARRAAERDDRPWTGAIERMDRAIAAHDISAAERALQEAYKAAVTSRRWDGMVAVGDAYARLGVAAHQGNEDRARARQAYLAAFFLARRQQSLDGVLRTVEGFSDLGDREVAAQCLKTAEALAAKSKTPGARHRVAGYADRLGAHGVVATSGF